MAMPLQSKNTLNRSAEVMNEGLDTPIKIEIKNEEEEPTGKSHGFICPKCEAHFLYESYFIEHNETHHEDIKVSEDLDWYGVYHILRNQYFSNLHPPPSSPLRNRL